MHTDADYHSGHREHTRTPAPFMSLSGYSQPRVRSCEWDQLGHLFHSTFQWLKGCRVLEE